MSDVIVKTEGLAKRYRRGKYQIDVLSDLNLSVSRGDFIALMGPSGSGKSTLLNLIGGLDTPSEGSVEVDGQRIDRMNAGQLAKWRANHVGYVFQFYNLMPNLTALKNVELPLLLHKMSAKERQRRAMVALTVVDLADRAKHRPAELSGGQQQRVAIARALVTDPTLVICDEPTGDLDRASADEILSLLSILNKDHGKTVIMVTHDPKAAEFAHHILHLDKGQLVDEVPA